MSIADLKIEQARMVQKHGTESEWNGSSFVPGKGEIIVYDPEGDIKYSRIKIGDGINTAANLEFSKRDGRGITSISVDKEGILTITYTDKQTEKAGNVMGPIGPEGRGISEAFIAEGDLYVKYTDDDDAIYNLGNVKGADGTSVAVESISESTLDGGENTIVFTDNKSITIKNGTKGSKGDPGETARVSGSTLELIKTPASLKGVGWTGEAVGAEVFNTTENIASGQYSHAEGQGTSATGPYSHAEGRNTQALSNCCHAEGANTIARNWNCHAEGIGTEAATFCQHVQGQYNVQDLDHYAHIVGWGTNEQKLNIHTVSTDGLGYFQHGTTTTGADYAEYFEWNDGNPNHEDRIGTIVALNEDKIYPAGPEDEILGVISGTAAVIGDNPECDWQGRFLVDNYGRQIMEEITEQIMVGYTENGEPMYEEYKRLFPKVNPEYDETKTYIRRTDRPEWDVVGLMGKLHVNDDGTCVPNGYAKCGGNGIATASAEKTNMRVMKRITDNIILVFIK